MEVKQSHNGPTIYTGNYVCTDLVQSVKDALETLDCVHVSFDVIGRTKHVSLSHELLEHLGSEYEADIDYDLYKCVVRRSAHGA